MGKGIEIGKLGLTRAVSEGRLRILRLRRQSTVSWKSFRKMQRKALDFATSSARRDFNATQFTCCSANLPRIKYHTALELSAFHKEGERHTADYSDYKSVYQ